MANETENPQLLLNISANSSKLEESLKKLHTMGGNFGSTIKDLKKGFIDFSSVATTGLKGVSTAFNEMEKNSKKLSKLLQNITNQYAGLNALENKAMVTGRVTNMKYGNLNYLDAYINKTKLAIKETVRLNQAVSGALNVKDIDFNITGRTLAERQASQKAIKQQLNYNTAEGRAAAEYDLRAQAEKNIQKANILEYGRLHNIDNIVEATKAYKDSVKATNDAAKATGNFQSKQQKLAETLPGVQLQIMANYAAINKLVSGFKYLINYSVQYDGELHQLQAISATTDTGLNKMRESIEAVAVSTKFTSLELAQASTVLAQAGLSATQISGTLPAIAKLATATGTELATTVDVITSSLNIYNLQTSEAEHITNALTTAMNESKADISGFQSAIQYAGNTAAQLNITFEETAAAVSAAAQAGVRSRSMLGTGLRAVLTEFLKPTKKLQEQLTAVGLGLNDIDVKSRGLNNVLKTLKEAGFGVEEAYKGMERRGASFLVNLLKQTDFMDDLRMKMAGSTAASKANETQMEALINQIKNFQNVLGTAATTGLQPFITLLSKLLSVINKLSQNKFFGGAFSILISGMALGGGIKTIQLMVNAWKAIATSFGIIGGSAGAVATAMSAIGGNANKVIGIATALKALWATVGGKVGILAGIASAIYMITDRLGLWESALDKANAKVEESKGRLEEAKQSYSSVQELIEKTYDSREKLSSQTERDIFLREILTKYPEASKFIDKVTLSYEELIQVLRELNNIKLKDIATEAKRTAEDIEKARQSVLVNAGKGLWANKDENGVASIDKLAQRLGGSSYSELRDLSRTVSNPPRGFGLFDIFFSSRGQRSAEDIYKTLEDVVQKEIQSGKDLTLVLSGIRSEAMRINIEGFTKVVDQFIDEYSAREAERKALLQSVTSETQLSVDELTGGLRDLYNATSEANTAVDEYKEKQKYGTEELEKLIETYKNLNEQVVNRSALIDPSTGRAKDTSLYTKEELSKVTGKSIEQIDSSFKEFSVKTSGFYEDEKEKWGSFVAEQITGNLYLDQAVSSLHSLETLIRAQGNKGVDFLDYYNNPAGYKNRAVKLMEKSTAFSKTKRNKSIESIKADTERYFRSSVIQKIQSGGGNLENINLGSIYDSKGNFVGTEKLTAMAEETARAAGITGENLVSFSEYAKGFSNTTSGLVDSLDKAIKNIPETNSKFDLAAAKMTDFFNMIERDIKKINTAYINAEKNLNNLVAKQEGTITATGRVFGENSGIVTAEQNNLDYLNRYLEGSRALNLENKLAGYRQTLRDLQSNPYYTEAKPVYENAMENYRQALNSDNIKLAKYWSNQADKVSNTYKKFAGEEEKLTKEIVEMEEELVKLRVSFEQENALRSMSSVDQLKYGFGTSAANYINQTQKEGLTTLAGSMNYFSTQGINTVESNFTSMFTAIADGSKKAGNAFKDFGKEVIQTLRDIAIQMAVKQGITALLSAFGYGTIDVTGQGVTGGNVLFSDGSYTGPLLGRASGGLVLGPEKNRDSVPVNLMPGEYVLKKSAVDAIGRGYLDNLNANASAIMNSSGEAVGEAKSTGIGSDSSGLGGVVNVYVVGQEQQAGMTPNDVVVTITQDMMKGGQTKQLVKSIAMGRL